jgi:hypothetical protein
VTLSLAEVDQTNDCEKLLKQLIVRPEAAGSPLSSEFEYCP